MLNHFRDLSGRIHYAGKTSEPIIGGKSDLQGSHSGRGGYVSRKSLIQPLHFVILGLSKNSLRVTLETVISQPGINPDLVLVCYNEYYGESAELAHLFHFRSKPLPASSSHPGKGICLTLDWIAIEKSSLSVQLARSLELVWSEYPTAASLWLLIAWCGADWFSDFSPSLSSSKKTSDSLQTSCSSCRKCFRFWKKTRRSVRCRRGM